MIILLIALVAGGIMTGLYEFLRRGVELEFEAANPGRWSNRWTKAEWDAWIIAQYRASMMREVTANMNKFREKMTNQKIDLGGN